MAQQLPQNQEGSIEILITDTGLVGITGLTSSDVACSYRKEGDSSFTSKSLDGDNFEEIGLGFYSITFTDTELDTLGTFTVVATGEGLVQSNTVAEVVLAETVADVGICVVTGHIADLMGSPIEDVAISARVLGSPTVLTEGAIQVGFTDTMLTAKTDANGFFSLELARNVTVDVLIPSIQYRRTLTVPDEDTVDLFLIP